MLTPEHIIAGLLIVAILLLLWFGSESRAARLERRLRQALNERDDVRDQIAECRNQDARLERRLRQALNERDDVRDQIAECRNQDARLERRLRQALNERDDVRDQIAECRNQGAAVPVHILNESIRCDKEIAVLRRLLGEAQ